jgi:hypothetical protein
MNDTLNSIEILVKSMISTKNMETAIKGLENKINVLEVLQESTRRIETKVSILEAFRGARRVQKPRLMSWRTCKLPFTIWRQRTTAWKIP